MSAISDKLSIFIPTYNRWDILEKTLEHLLIGNAVGVRVVVMDNASTQESSNKIDALVERFRQVPCKVVRHPVNIGGDANILRAIELCETPYLMMVGDDDFLCPNYLETINHYLGQEVNWGWIYFRLRDHDRQTDRIYTDPFAMLQAKNEWAELIFISSTVFNRDLLKLGLWKAQLYQFSKSAHLVGVLKGWEALSATDKATLNYKFMLSGARIIESAGHARDHRSFEQMGIYPGLSVLRFLFDDPEEFLIVRNAVRGGTRFSFKPRVLTKECFYYAQEYGFKKAWRSALNLQAGLSYSIGWRYLIYAWYIPLAVLVSSAIGLLKRALRIDSNV